ncbi:MAG: crossover junction endodeoxyribonuclease RuvC, crossover junction endodeoxyribonuclease RuvC [Candidatus Parcubacteria bacterium]|jgi:crossover junction endodeoxyribonuclease RuvC
MRILAIDPGYDRLGIAVVEGNASKPILVWSTCITPPKGETVERLAHISRAVTDAISTYAPDVVAIETLFFNINKKTAIGVAQARGAILAAAGLASLSVVEYSPQQIKSAVTGHGGADKTAMARMIPKLLTLPTKKRLDDELDAIGIGITALARGAIHM